MKKIICFSIVILALVAASCNKNVNPPEEVPSDAFVATIGCGSAANMPSADGVRPMTYINEARDVFWNIGDQILVNGATYTLDRAVTVSSDPNYGVFTNSTLDQRPAKQDGLWKAIYPASAGYSLPSSQNGSFTNIPMYAQSADSTLRFDIITAVLKIVVPAEANNARLITIAADKSLSGAFTVADPGTNPHAVMSGDYGTVSVTGQFNTGDAVYVPIPADTYSTLLIYFYSDEGREQLLLDKQMTSSTTFKVNRLYTVRIDNYFYLEAKQANSTVSYQGAGTLQYSTNKSDWKDYSEQITLSNIGDKVYFKAKENNTVIGRETIPSFELSGNLKVGGNIMYLLNVTANDKDFSNNSDQFRYLFYGQPALTDASDLKLPSCALTYGCFADMFDYYTGLTSAPALPSTNLATYCYSEMFFGCSALTAAPELPATTMVYGCYNSMFNGCSALTAAPALPATTLAPNCYALMFKGCTALTVAPELPATTLAGSCYSTMFNGCSNLSSVTMKATDVSAQNCLQHWLDGAGTSATGTDARKVHVVNDAAVVSAVQATLPTGAYSWTAVGDQ